MLSELKNFQIGFKMGKRAFLRCVTVTLFNWLWIRCFDWISIGEMWSYELFRIDCAYLDARWRRFRQLNLTIITYKMSWQNQTTFANKNEWKCITNSNKEKLKRKLLSKENDDLNKFLVSKHQKVRKVKAKLDICSPLFLM